MNVCIFLFIAVYIVCWTRTEDVHGYYGTPLEFSTVEECLAACIKDSTCVAIDWEPTNADGQTCWILAMTFTRNTTTTGVIVHYERRDCPGEYY